MVACWCCLTLQCICRPVALQLNRLIASKLAAVSSTRLLGSVLGDLQQAARRLRELLGSILAAAATAAGATAAAGSAAGAAAGGGGGEANGALQKDGSSAAVAAGVAAEGGAKGAAAASAVKTELKLLQLLLDPLEAQVGWHVVGFCCCCSDCQACQSTHLHSATTRLPAFLPPCCSCQLKMHVAQHSTAAV